MPRTATERRLYQDRTSASSPSFVHGLYTSTAFAEANPIPQYDTYDVADILISFIFTGGKFDHGRMIAMYKEIFLVAIAEDRRILFDDLPLCSAP